MVTHEQKFCFFNPISWPFLKTRPDEWPFPIEGFDPIQAGELVAAQIDQFVFAEECGFDWLATGEDHMTAYGLTPNPALIMAALAQRTRVAKLAILGQPVPVLNPIRVAEEDAMLDVMSNGRLIVGLIRGVPQTYAAYNFDPNESRGRFDEAVQLIVKAWTDPTVFDWRSRYYDFPAVSIWPRPVQKPYPPLVFSANSPESAIIGAKYGAIIGAIHLYTRDSLERISASVSAYRRQAREDGWEPLPDRFLIGLPTCIAETDELARSLLDPALDYQFTVLSGTYDIQKREIARTKPGYGYSPVEENPPSLTERIDSRTVLCGSPATVTSQIYYLRERLGVGLISMHFQIGNMPDSAVRCGMRLFRDEVRPRFAGRSVGQGAVQ